MHCRCDDSMCGPRADRAVPYGCAFIYSYTDGGPTTSCPNEDAVPERHAHGYCCAHTHPDGDTHTHSDGDTHTHPDGGIHTHAHSNTTGWGRMDRV